MTHLPFVAGAYALGILIPAALSVSAFFRMRSAARRLAVIDPRGRRAARGPEDEEQPA